MSPSALRLLPQTFASFLARSFAIVLTMLKLRAFCSAKPDARFNLLHKIGSI